jgi:hypothetical protein
MGIVSILLLASLAQAPEVQISTLGGQQHAGRLQSLTGPSASVQTADGNVDVPFAQLLEVRFTSSNDLPAAADPLPQVYLVDGSTFPCEAISTADGKTQLKSPLLGSFSVPIAAVAAIRFAPADSRAIEDGWNALRQREVQKDLLVIRKENNVLDHLDGVAGAIDGQHVRFLIDADEIPVKREKVFGIIYYRRDPQTVNAACRLELVGAYAVNASSLIWDGSQFRAKLLSGSEVVLPPDKLLLADFSFGKLRYLSQMEPRDVEYTPFFDVTWKYRRDRNLDGGPLRLGNKTYSRGLCIHSKTFLRYRIGGDYRRFQAVMGIDQIVGQRGNVHVVISGDGKTLLETDVTGFDEPQPLDLDVSGVRDLEILVDFGGDLDIADHLDLADAKVIK